MTEITQIARLAMPPPISTNGLYRNVPGAGRVVTRKYAAWKRLAAQYLSAQGPLPTFSVPVTVLVYVGETDVGAMDSDNTLKAYLDALKEFGVIVDDNRKWVRGSAARWVQGLRGAVVVVEETGGELTSAYAIRDTAPLARGLLS